jgi:hypothetical protein
MPVKGFDKRLCALSQLSQGQRGNGFIADGYRVLV